MSAGVVSWLATPSFLLAGGRRAACPLDCPVQPALAVRPGGSNCLGWGTWYTVAWGEHMAFRRIPFCPPSLTMAGPRFPAKGQAILAVRHGVWFLIMALRMTSSLRMQATSATFLALPAAQSRW